MGDAVLVQPVVRARRARPPDGHGAGDTGSFAAKFAASGFRFRDMSAKNAAGETTGRVRPAPAGYSGTPLPKKLGIKAGHAVALVGAPAGFAGALEPLPDRVTVAGGLAGGALLDVIVWFVVSRGELAARLDSLRARMAPACGLWVAWPKRASKVPTDVTEDVVREIALPTGLVDNKVCAIDPVWSGLRLVIRRELR